MPDPLMTMSKATLKSTSQVTSGALALTFGDFAVTAPAGAAPMQVLQGLASPGLQVEGAGYRRARKFRPLYGPDYYVA
jgi:hypothetical protein